MESLPDKINIFIVFAIVAGLVMWEVGKLTVHYFFKKLTKNDQTASTDCTNCSQHEVFKQIIKEQSEREKNNFNLLKDMVETSQYHAAILSRVEHKIDSNDFCPMIKKEKP